MQTGSKYRDAVPFDPIRDIVLAHLPDPEDEGFLEASTVMSLRSGLAERTLYDYLKWSPKRRGGAPRATIRFDTADKIITKGVGKPWLWWTELREIYEAVDLSETAPSRAEYQRQWLARRKAARATA